MVAGSKSWVYGWSLELRVRILLRGWMFFPGVKQPGNEVGHSPPTSAEVKNERNCTSTSLICLHGVDGETFIFYRIGVLCDDDSPFSHMIVPNIDCCVGPYCYRVEETSRHATATATLHFLPLNRPPLLSKASTRTNLLTHGSIPSRLQRARREGKALKPVTWSRNSVSYRPLGALRYRKLKLFSSEQLTSWYYIEIFAYFPHKVRCVQFVIFSDFSRNRR